MRKGLISLALAYFITPTIASELIYDKFTPSVQYRHTNSDNEVAKKFLVEIEKVPDPIQKLLEERGGKIVFFDGPLIANPEFHNNKNKNPSGWSKDYTWNDLHAGYIISSKTIFLGVYRSSMGMEDPSLHEYGHCFDFIIGEYLYRMPLSETQNIPEIIKKESYDSDYFNQPREYIANSFDQFYRSKETKKSLKENQPTIYKLLLDIESIITKTKNSK